MVKAAEEVAVEGAVVVGAVSAVVKEDNTRLKGKFEMYPNL